MQLLAQAKMGTACPVELPNLPDITISVEVEQFNAIDTSVLVADLTHLLFS